MNRRAEFTLLGLVGLAFLAAGLLIWGQQTGQVTIFGDALTSVVNPLPLSTLAVVQTSFTETFESLTYFDPVTSADWNIEAGEVTLLYGETEGIVRSSTLASLKGKTVWVQMSAQEDRPEGSAIHYAVSADGGATWQTISAARPAVFADPPGTWQWRALLNRGVASRPPAITELTFDFYRQ